MTPPPFGFAVPDLSIIQCIFTHIQNLLYLWHIQNSDIFKTSAIFRSLSDKLHCLWKIVPDCNYFCKELLFRPFQTLGRILGMPMYLQVPLSLQSYFTFCFRHIQTYSSIIQEHTHAYSQPCVSLPNSEPWSIPIIKHIQTPRYNHNTTLNIFTKARSWTFDTVLNNVSFIDAI